MDKQIYSLLKQKTGGLQRLVNRLRITAVTGLHGTLGRPAWKSTKHMPLIHLLNLCKFTTQLDIEYIITNLTEADQTKLYYWGNKTWKVPYSDWYVSNYFI